MANSDKRQRQKDNARAAREAREAAQKRSRRNKAIIRLLVAAVLVAAIAGIVALVSDDEGDDVAADTSTTVATEDTTTTTTGLPELVPTECTDDEPEDVADRPTFDAEPEMTIDATKSYTATITTSCGEIVAELDAANAPVATNNFVFLAREGLYDGLTWHRVVPDFVIQGGDPAGDGTGGVDYSVAGEVPSDNYPYGSLAAAKAPDEPPGTMGSQFFVVTGPNGTTLPNEYARFGSVTAGFDVARTLESFADVSNPEQRPSRPLYIFSVEITES